MFTGIIEEIGRVRGVEPFEGGVRLSVAAERVIEDLALGDSIALDGVCQTVVALEEDGFHVEAIGTTLSRTVLGDFEPGRRVNLERPLALGERLGGHLVQGHVDGLGTVRSIERRGEHVLVDIALPEAVAEATVPHGSIAVNGVSLTVNEIPAPDIAQVALIPHTWEHTTFPDLCPGDAVHLEGDMIGKYVVGHLRRRGSAGREAPGHRGPA